MKKITILLLAASVFAIAAKAQKGGGGMQNMKQQLVDSLHFTPAQADSTVAVEKQYRPMFRQLMTDTSASKMDKMSQVKSLHEQEKARLAGFLSADQIAQLDAMRKKMQMQRPMRMNGAPNSDN